MMFGINMVLMKPAVISNKIIMSWRIGGDYVNAEAYDGV
jgi:hypothetical protein